MRRLRASIGLRHSCAEGAESSCCIHREISTESIIRIELEWQTYADSNRVHITNLPLIVENTEFQALRRCLKGHLFFLIPSCCGIVPSRNFWMALEMVWNILAMEAWDRKLKSLAELHSWIEELQRLKDQMEAVEMLIANAVSDESLILNCDTDPFPKKVCTHSQSSEFRNLESTAGVDSAQAATATLHKAWLDIKSADVSVQTQHSGELSFFSVEKVRQKVGQEVTY